MGKILGLFIERVPVDQQGRPQKPVPQPRGTAPQQAQAPGARPASAPHQQVAAPPVSHTPVTPVTMPGAPAPGPIQQPGAPVTGVAPPMGGPTPVSVALRANIPQEYAGHLAPHGVHVVATGGHITSEQSRAWGAQVLVVSAECLGQDMHLVQSPQLPTVFIATQPVMLPEQPGLVQVQEPLHASDVARAIREAAAQWTAAGRPTSQ